ncbi:xanthine dehydrogenase family protein molybdopterin-binding subunit [Geodermatophilus sp. YIM 151500]|uniref:xanthine dehydrogenase family protein molybdopterin-binding subunit n=1 Tax=Geodermatophilus sp. YIM 151500 TaxID=2984531 RepID=UPI0021E37A46|nr:xanthine dehydrogenase family protein molybdopterin-binding subunit [Geodermatophilus sp. YIM 151500]MCV2488891.1 xanthine dehydrogenase family protein molybdopterin-binding subunit [Geodermatophilus sp. YIM 151500]
MTGTGYVGRAVRRREDPRLLAGRGRYVDDVTEPRQAYVAFVRSPVASARIARIDTSAARSAPDVLAVLTADDLAGHCSGWRGLLSWPGMVAGEQTALATGVVRHVGEPVALVVATGRGPAEDAAELVEVDYEERPAVLDPVAALEPGSPLVHEELGTNLCFASPFGSGDVDAAFAGADTVVDVTVRTGRHTAVALETRGILAAFDRDERTLTVRISTQAPQMLQTLYARLLGLPENSVRVITEHVGGAFGMKAFVYPDEIAVAAAAMLLDRPLKWTQDRYEAMQSDTQARDERVTASLALTADGRILGLRSQVVSDAGAWSMYPRGCVTEGVQVATIMPGPYRVPAVAADLRVVYTNKAPLAVYRAVGHPPAILVMELLMDEAARALGLAPDEVRRRNLVRPEDLPYTSATGNVYDSGSHLESLERAVALLGPDGLEERRRDAAARGRLLGVGLAAFVELSAPGAMFYGAKGAPITAHDQVEVTLQPDGSVTVLLGTPGQGQGLHTTAAQVVADGLGVPLEAVRVVSGDTGVVPHGSGVWASRSAVVSAGAAHAAAVEVRGRVLALAGHLLEADPADLELSEGVVGVRGVPGTRVPVHEIAAVAYWGTHRLPPDLEVGLGAVGSYAGPPYTFNNGTHVAVVEVERATGLVRVVDYVVVEDCGVLINPDIVDGQIRGGVAQGLGGALLEQVVHDPNGQPQTSTMLDYLVPTAYDVPDIRIEHIQTPAPTTTLGTKGVGEAGTAGAPAAVHCAVNDALARAGAGGVFRQPIRPEDVLDALDRAPASR